MTRLIARLRRLFLRPKPLAADLLQRVRAAEALAGVRPSEMVPSLPRLRAALGRPPRYVPSYRRGKS